MGFPDTGPQEDGTRTEKQWLNAMAEDMSLIRMQIDMARKLTLKEAQAQHLAAARKEANRLTRDIERFGAEVYGISKAEIDGKRV